MQISSKMPSNPVAGFGTSEVSHQNKLCAPPPRLNRGRRTVAHLGCFADVAGTLAEMPAARVSRRPFDRAREDAFWQAVAGPRRRVPDRGIGAVACAQKRPWRPQHLWSSPDVGAEGGVRRRVVVEGLSALRGLLLAAQEGLEAWFGHSGGLAKAPSRAPRATPPHL